MNLSCSLFSYPTIREADITAGAEAAILDPDWGGYVEDGRAALVLDDFLWIIK